MNIQTIQSATSHIFQKYQVRKAALFGSTARGETGDQSDIDLMVELPDRASLYDFINLQLDLEDALRKKVDLVEYDMIKSRLKPFILRDQKLIYVRV
jgi:predicted nucleotidyltransferase